MRERGDAIYRMREKLCKPRRPSVTFFPRIKRKSLRSRNNISATRVVV
jgi:hypothetical protein